MLRIKSICRTPNPSTTPQGRPPRHWHHRMCRVSRRERTDEHAGSPKRIGSSQPSQTAADTAPISTRLAGGGDVERFCHRCQSASQRSGDCPVDIPGTVAPTRATAHSGEECGNGRASGTAGRPARWRCAYATIATTRLGSTTIRTISTSRRWRRSEPHPSRSRHCPGVSPNQRRAARLRLLAS
jgi:hypothetical protein